MVKGYHHTSERAFEEIKNKGLHPMAPIIFPQVRGLPEQAYDLVVCGLLSSKPKEWVRNEDFPYIWQVLKSHLEFVRGYQTDPLILSWEVSPMEMS